MNKLLFSGLILLCLYVSLASGQTRACDLTIGSIGGSPGGQWNLAVKLGWIDPTAFKLCVINSSGSVDLYTGLANGTYDATSAQFDNALSRWVNGILPVQTLGGDSRGIGQAIVGNIGHGINHILDLKGKVIGVDAVESGLVYGLRKVLAAYGLYYPQDYSFVICGGTPQRTTCTQNGYVTINGTNYEVDASSLPLTAVKAGITSNLANVPDFISPLQSTAFQITNTTMLKKRSQMTTYLYHLIRAQKFFANPANQNYVLNYLQTGSTAAAAQTTYAQFFDPVNGQVTATNDFTFEAQSIWNVVYVRQQFSGFNVPSSYNFDQLLTPTYGGFIDYSVRDAANIMVGTNLTVKTQHSSTDVNQCYNYANGNVLTFPNYLANLGRYVSGSCTGAPVLGTPVIVSADSTAEIGDFTYNAATDTLTLVANTNYNANNAATSRTVKISVSVNDACTIGSVDTISQSYTFYHANSGPSSCTSFQPPCTVQVTQSLVSQWFSNGVNTYQYNLDITNPSTTQQVTSVVFQLSSTDANDVSSIWNLQNTDSVNHLYTLPSWQNGIAAGSSYTQAGYIVNNAQATFNVQSATCQ